MKVWSCLYECVTGCQVEKFPGGRCGVFGQSMHIMFLSIYFIDVAAPLVAILAVQFYHGKLDFVCVDTPGDYYGLAVSFLIALVLALNDSSSLIE
ncbi:hypothetical protein V8C40DRAFT_233494 [Trichoderma camerunense]